jgi:hypothetical protein
VYLAYIDDSEFTAKKDQQKSAKQAKQQQEEQFLVLCSVLVHDRLFAALEMRLTIHALLGYGLPEDFPPDFEFHAYELFDGTGVFENWDQPKRFHIFQQCMETVVQLQLPVLYGAVDKAKLAKQIYKSANPLDVSFRSFAGFGRLDSVLPQDADGLTDSRIKFFPVKLFLAHDCQECILSILRAT